MRRFILAVFLVLGATALFGATTNERITLSITITNAPVTSNTFVFNGSTREWTNASSATTILTNLQGTAWATTNLFNNLAAFSQAGGPWTIVYSATNALRIVGPVGSSLAASAAGDWCTLALSTQQVVRLRSVLYPFNGLIDSNATDQATEIVTGINSYSTNAFATNSTALGNFLRRTNAYGSNVIIHTLKSTNGVNYGIAFGSPGPSNYSHHFAGGLADNDYAISIGESSTATARLGIALGSYASAGGTNTIAIGFGADAAAGTNGIVIGANSQIVGNKTMAIGNGSAASYNDSIAIGNSVTTTRTNEIRLGGSQDVVVGGLLSVAGTLTNNSVRFTGGTLTNVSAAFISALATSLTAHAASLTNVNMEAATATVTNLTALSGLLTNARIDRGFSTNLTLAGAATVAAGANIALPAVAIDTLADGHNVVDVGSNAFVRLTGGSLTAIWQLGGLVGDIRNGRQVVVENATGYGMLVLHESGTAPTAGQRITCGGSFIISSGGMVSFVYDSTATRWKIVSSRDTFGQNGLLFVSVGTNYNGTNWAPLTTNIAAGYYPVGAFAQLASATSNYLACSGATADYTNMFSASPPTRETTNAVAVGTGTLIPVNAGYYLVNATITVWAEVDNNGDEIELEIFLDGVPQNHTESHVTLATGVKATLSTSSLLYIPAGASVTARIRNESDASCNLPVIQLRLNLDSP